jgi:hypothetical protein
MEKKMLSSNDNNKNLLSKDFESVPRIAQPPISLPSFNAIDPQKNSEYHSSSSQSPIPPTPSSQSPIPPTPFLTNETSLEDFQFLSTLQS